MRTRRSGKTKGFTLIEVMVTMLVFAISMISLISLYVGTTRLTESSRNLTQAMNDARTVSEAIRDTSSAGLAAVTAVDWADWGIANNLTSLANEAVAVTYPGGLAVDPLWVTIQVSWLERNHPKTATIDTMVTQR